MKPTAIRVTEVLDAWKEDWYIDWVCKVGKREAKRTSTVASNIGTAVDEIIKTGSSKVKANKDEVRMCLEAFKKWKEVYRPSVFVPCQRVSRVVEEVEVSGEPDALIDDVLTDYKCAREITPKYWIQVMVYRWLRGETGKVAILRLDKYTGQYEYVVKDYDQRLVDVWVGLLRAYVYFKGEADGGDIDVREGNGKEAVA